MKINILKSILYTHFALLISSTTLLADNQRNLSLSQPYSNCLAKAYVRNLQKNDPPTKTIDQIRQLAERNCRRQETKMKKNLSKAYECSDECPIAVETAEMIKQGMYLTIKFELFGPPSN
ncbi:hypothetical protein [Cognatishimia activa]|uniref:Secreted protein n=1 Tax=Cognatishimia activa TaxID=1715691 RepID=A0A975ER31_9RHOB|nr:hypothetical protein [Cognatishimia activa]QTN36797.1 hypothetical protein HZ995_04585 [Cognatishimia activa]